MRFEEVYGSWTERRLTQEEANWAKFEHSGHTLTNDMAEMANKRNNTDFFKEGMKVDDYGVGKDGLMINKASMTEGGGKGNMG